MDQNNLQFSESSSDSSIYQNAQRLTDDELDIFSNHEDEHTMSSEDVPIIDTQPSIGIEQIESEVFVDEDIPQSSGLRDIWHQDQQTIDISVSQNQELLIPPAKFESEGIVDEDIPLATKFRRSEEDTMSSGLRDIWYQDHQTIDISGSQNQEFYIPPAKKLRRSDCTIDLDCSQSEDLFKDSEVAAKMDEQGTSGTSGTSEDLFKCTEVTQIVSPKMDEAGTSGLSSEEIKLSNIEFFEEMSEKCLKMVKEADMTDEDIEEMYAISCSRYLDKFLLKKHPDDIQKRQKLLAKIKKAGEEGIYLKRFMC